jgi:hypothetical protein
MSVVEAVANVVVGYGAAVAVQLALFPMFGLIVSLARPSPSALWSPWYRFSGAICYGASSRLCEPKIELAAPSTGPSVEWSSFA